ncbi:MAG: hypothetical protein HKL81_08040 [Acidimicrobiaceae bacterium]|nr:hypothetical protein [Acidimicrobiaceae bacterium]
MSKRRLFILLELTIWYLPVLVSLLFQTTFTGWTAYAPLSNGYLGSSFVRFPKTFLLVPLLLFGLLSIKKRRPAIIASSLVVIAIAASFLFLYIRVNPAPVGRQVAGHTSISLYLQFGYPDSATAFISVFLSWLAVAGLGLTPFLRDKS